MTIVQRLMRRLEPAGLMLVCDECEDRHEYLGLTKQEAADAARKDGWYANSTRICCPECAEQGSGHYGAGL